MFDIWSTGSSSSSWTEHGVSSFSFSYDVCFSFFMIIITCVAVWTIAHAHDFLFHPTKQGTPYCLKGFALKHPDCHLIFTTICILNVQLPIFLCIFFYCLILQTCALNKHLCIFNKYTFAFVTFWFLFKHGIGYLFMVYNHGLPYTLRMTFHKQVLFVEYFGVRFLVSDDVCVLVGWFRFFLEVQRIHMKQWRTLERLLVYHTTTTSLIWDQREGKLRRPEVEETTWDLGTKSPSMISIPCFVSQILNSKYHVLD